MHFDMEENWDVNQKVYEMPSMGTNLEPRNLKIEERPTRHWVSLVGMGVRRGIRGPQRCFRYKSDLQ
jgi:hypothetical protein